MYGWSLKLKSVNGNLLKMMFAFYNLEHAQCSGMKSFLKKRFDFHHFLILSYSNSTILRKIDDISFCKTYGLENLSEKQSTRFDHALKLFSILSTETNLTVSFRLCSDVLDQGLWGYMDCSRNFLQWF